jgi:hypothetical protein
VRDNGGHLNIQHWFIEIYRFKKDKKNMPTKKAGKTVDSLNRSLKIDLALPEQSKHLYKPILNSIRKYRATARKLFTACAMAEMAGASIVLEKNKKGEDDIKIKPDNEASKLILANSFGMDGKAHLYQLRSFVREELAPEWHSFVWDSLRQDVSSRWTSPDPEFSKAKRGWLVTQGARALARFMHIGIGFPIATGRPKMDSHKLSLKWDETIGAVDFIIPRLDGSSYYVWKCIRDGEEGWKPGTVYLNERDGKLFAVLSYSCPLKKADIDLKKELTVEFTEDRNTFITIHGSEAFSGDVLSAEEAIGWLSELLQISEGYKVRISAAGNPHKKWGDRKAHEALVKRLNNVTERRTNGQKTRNHLWTRRIVENAIRTGCGTVVVINFPEREFFGHPWSWFQFETFLNYKMTEIGGKLIVRSAVKKVA